MFKRENLHNTKWEISSKVKIVIFLVTLLNRLGILFFLTNLGKSRRIYSLSIKIKNTVKLLGFRGKIDCALFLCRKLVSFFLHQIFLRKFLHQPFVFFYTNIFHGTIFWHLNVGSTYFTQIFYTNFLHQFFTPIFYTNFLH